MNYSNTIRNYLQDHQDELFDIGYEYSHKFGMMEKKTFNRLILRFEKDGLLSKVAKGVYYIKGKDDFSEDKILDYYCGNESGMVVGDKLFEKLFLKDHVNEYTIISNKLESNKTIGSVSLIKVDNLFLFTPNVQNMIILLELYERLKKPFDDSRFIFVAPIYVRLYNDLLFEEVISHLRYQPSTIMKLKESLDAGNIKNNIVDIFIKHYKHD